MAHRQALPRTPARLALAGALVAAAAGLVAGCGQKKTELGEGGSVVTGSAGPAGAHNASHELLKCDAPVATMALVENPNGYTVQGSYNLPASPLPLVRLIAQQSGCFRVVDRSSGLHATVQEQELKDAGIIRKNSTVHKGNGYEAQYTITPSLTFSEQNAGREIGGILSHIPVLNKLVGFADNVKLKEAQVALLLTDNETTEQIAAATGSVRVTDLGMAGLEQHERGQGDRRRLPRRAQPARGADACPAGQGAPAGRSRQGRAGGLSVTSRRRRAARPRCARRR